MANLIDLIVSKITESTNGGFILTLQNKTATVTPFGKKEQSITYYMKVAEKVVEPGFNAKLNLDDYQIVERDFIPEDGENAGKIIPCKWLQLPVAA